MDQIRFGRAELREITLPAYPGIARDAIRLVVTEEQAEVAFVELIQCDAIGFDTESKPSFRKGENSGGPHLVQLATETHAYLYPLGRARAFSALRAVLEAPQVIKVGFGLGNDCSALRESQEISLINMLDLGEVLRGAGHRGTVGAKVAVAHFLGLKLQKSKRTGTSNWAASRLAERQLLYAANDAQVALRVYRAWVRENA